MFFSVHLEDLKEKTLQKQHTQYPNFIFSTTLQEEEKAFGGNGWFWSWGKKDEVNWTVVVPRSHDKPKNQTRAQVKRTRESRLRGVHVKMAQELAGRVPSGPNWNKFDQQNGGAL